MIKAFVEMPVATTRYRLRRGDGIPPYMCRRSGGHPQHFLDKQELGNFIADLKD